MNVNLKPLGGGKLVGGLGGAQAFKKLTESL